ncbi:MAG TPA: MBL fold metallo-hydrolase, partial [Candidatus Binatia bacterium]|nr:MBL fold metallo-hydrolase [Candidatus Binatia bacterium]
TVNCYLVWDPKSKAAVAFDTGADSGPMLKFAKERGLAIKLILLTHTHPDHIADLGRLKKETGAPVHVSSLEPVPGADGFSTGKSFQVDALKIETRQTSGHSKGGITYVISGLERPVAVVGDALFAGSMGGGAISWDDALANNRKHIFSLPDDTVICPGHGPLTTVREEKRNNPFYPEFKN